MVLVLTERPAASGHDDRRCFVESHLTPTLTRGLVALCKAKPEEPVRWLAEWLLENKPSPAESALTKPIATQVAFNATETNAPHRAEVGSEFWKANEGPELVAAMKNVKLIKLQSLIRLAEQQASEREQHSECKTKMPRCQEWAEEDVADSLELINWVRPRASDDCLDIVGSGTGLPIIVLSICWLAKNHPDERGEQLALLLPIFRMYAAIGPYAVLWDYCSLPQRDWASESEMSTFKMALKAINEW